MIIMVINFRQYTKDYELSFALFSRWYRIAFMLTGIVYSISLISGLHSSHQCYYMTPRCPVRFADVLIINTISYGAKSCCNVCHQLYIQLI